ncbi:MAG: hypothetical protein ABJU19_22025 [Roseobacter sp.]
MSTLAFPKCIYESYPKQHISKNDGLETSQDRPDLVLEKAPQKRRYETALRRELPLEFVVPNVFEIVSLLIAAGALIFAALAFSVAKQAIKATKESDITALQVKAQDSISDAKRSFLLLQEACLLTRRDWENHKSQHFPQLGDNFGRSMFAEPDETQHISEIERTGSKALGELLASMPSSDALTSSELHQFIAKAQFTSTQIERLKLGLEGPKPFRH